MALAGNKYSLGSEQAFVSAAQMKARWNRDARGLNFLNLAFETYYKASTSIDACPESDHKVEMRKTLDDCATAGFGLGVCDLDDAFQHLIKTGGNWTDENSKSYSGKFQRLVGGPVMDGPCAAANFLHCVEQKFKLLTEIITDFNEQSRKVADTSNWALIREALKNMKDNGNKAKKVLWLAPATVQGPAKTAISFVKALDEIDVAVRDIDKLRQVGMNDTAAFSFELAKIVAGKVPVLGKFYGKIIGELPDFFVNMNEVFKERQEKILNLAHLH